ncbi:MAG: acetyl-CoA acetyltransferase [Proteobacteria bacterium]|jgi:acetyl-CoA C-acetyltransferase|nr:acetyl-CoA acetyltransferase [Pseudomonadota bacterium]
MQTTPIYVLGGHQSDFALNASRAGSGLFELMQEAVRGALDDCRLKAQDIQTAHVGNFVGELFTGQGQLGGMLSTIDPGLYGTPASRHEAACASGSIAILAATAEIEAGRYDCALVTGVELERNVPGALAAQHLGAACWVGQEGTEAKYVWPHMFHRVGEEYARRHGLRYEHLARIAEINIANARRNPLAQTRDWRYSAASFTEDDEANPVIEGMIRRQDCGQVTDGAAAVVLASHRFASAWARDRGIDLETVPRIAGWGHRTAPLMLDAKLQASAGQPLVFPHVHQAIQDAFRRAGVRDVFELQGIETHDCFTTTEYMAIDHFGITPPGRSWEAIEDGTIEAAGRLPVNPSGGLIGLGHPVGATGVRMVFDAARQVAGRAGDCQVEGAQRFGTLNVGGSATTVVSFVLESGAAR